MALRNGIVIDAAAELPSELLAHPQLRVLPVRIQIDDRYFLDKRDPATVRQFNAQHLNKNSASAARSVPYKFDEMRAFFLAEVACDFDHVFGVFISKTRSTIFQTAFDSASRVITESVPIRNQAGLKGPLFVECYDSQNFFSGYGVQILELLRTLGINGSQTGIRNRLEFIAPRSYTYVAPSDLEFILTRAKSKGEDSVGIIGAAAAKFLNVLPVLRGHRGETTVVSKARGHKAGCDYVLKLARRELARGLVAPCISVSYSGSTGDVQAMPEYQLLASEASAQNVQLALSEMSPTNSVNLGPKALSVGFIAEPHEPTL